MMLWACLFGLQQSTRPHSSPCSTALSEDPPALCFYSPSSTLGAVIDSVSAQGWVSVFLEPAFRKAPDGGQCWPCEGTFPPAGTRTGSPGLPSPTGGREGGDGWLMWQHTLCLLLCICLQIFLTVT